MKNKSNIIIALLCAIVLFLLLNLAKVDNKDKEITKNHVAPKDESQLLTDKARCQKDGKQFYDEKKRKESDDYSVLGKPSYAFNQSLNTCLVAWQDSAVVRTDNGSVIFINHITDIYSNNDVYSWYQKSTSPFKSPPVDYLGSEVEYNQKLQYYGLF